MRCAGELPRSYEEAVRQVRSLFLTVDGSGRVLVVHAKFNGIKYRVTISMRLILIIILIIILHFYHLI